jgi:DNA (cytosine-5)-methyltransferase 1
MTINANVYFAGTGLVEIGLEEAGISIQQSFEIDGDCCTNLRRNFKHEVVEGDIREKLVKADKAAAVKVFTFPCNRYAEISAVHGKRTGDELFLHALRHMVIDPPEVYVIENVPGMKKFPVVMEALTQLPNYYVNVFCPVASEMWLPQKRDRLIVIGSRKPFAWRAPRAGRRVALREILECDPENFGGLGIPDYVYRRLNWAYRDQPIITERDGVAPTCVAHYAKDLSTRLVRDRRFRRQVRPYTIREYARLQGVPDWFYFPPVRKSYRMIGNGVSVPVARWFGREIRRYFKR